MVAIVGERPLYNDNCTYYNVEKYHELRVIDLIKVTDFTQLLGNSRLFIDVNNFLDLF